jgi:hypothetical protein
MEHWLNGIDRCAFIHYKYIKIETKTNHGEYNINYKYILLFFPIFTVTAEGVNLR